MERPADPDDAELVAATLAGDREAFGQLYDKYARMVRAVTAGASGDWSAVEDMVQECFLRAYRKLGTLRAPERFGPWIVGFARKVGRERRRSLRRDRHEFRELWLAEVAAPLDVQAEVCNRDQLEVVMRRLGHLPEQERLAVHAFFLQQHDAQHVANLLGLSRSGFYLLVQRAIAHLAARNQACESRQTKER